MHIFFLALSRIYDSLRRSNSPIFNLGLFFDFWGVNFLPLGRLGGCKKPQKGENWKLGNLTLMGIIQPTYTPKISLNMHFGLF